MSIFSSYSIKQKQKKFVDFGKNGWTILAQIFCGVSTNLGKVFHWSKSKIKLESEISEIFQLEVVKKQHFKEKLISRNRGTKCSVFNEFELRLKSAKTRFQLNAGLNLEKLITILSGTNYIWAAPRLKFLKFGLW